MVHSTRNTTGADDAESSYSDPVGSRFEYHVATVISQLTASVGRLERQQLEPPQQAPLQDVRMGPNIGIPGEDQALERFLQFNPPKFTGGPDDEMAEGWLHVIECIFRVLQYEDAQKIIFTSSLLEAAAIDWWRVVEGKWATRPQPMTWEDFTTEFREQFIPQLVRDRKETEFINLKQAAKSVAKYEAQFSRLSTYAPNLVSTDDERKKQFVQGLNIEIQNAMVGMPVPTYAVAVDRAMRLEESHAALQAFYNSKKEGQRSKIPPTGGVKKGGNKSGEPPAKHGYEERMERKGSGGDGRQQRIRSSKVCHFCHKPGHIQVECRMKNRQCFRCGSTTHIISQCLQLTVQGGRPEPVVRPNTPRAPAQDYAIKQREEAPTPYNIKGNR